MPTTFIECTEEHYDYMLGVVPPAIMDAKGFMVGEPLRHNEHGQPLFAAFIHMNGKFYESEHAMTVREYRALEKSDIVTRPAAKWPQAPEVTP